MKKLISIGIAMIIFSGVYSYYCEGDDCSVQALLKPCEPVPSVQAADNAKQPKKGKETAMACSIKTHHPTSQASTSAIEIVSSKKTPEEMPQLSVAATAFDLHEPVFMKTTVPTCLEEITDPKLKQYVLALEKKAMSSEN